jgi:hypothetical protein
MRQVALIAGIPEWRNARTGVRSTGGRCHSPKRTLRRGRWRGGLLLLLFCCRRNAPKAKVNWAVIARRSALTDRKGHIRMRLNVRSVRPCPAVLCAHSEAEYKTLFRMVKCRFLSPHPYGPCPASVATPRPPTSMPKISE